MPDVNKSVNISFNASTQNLEQNLKKIPDVTDRELKKAADSLDKNFKKMETSAKKTHRFISEDAEKAFKKYGAAVAVPVAATLLLTQHLADLSNELVDASAKSGVAVDTLAGLRLAAEGAGLEFGGLADSLNQFQVQIADAAAGAGNAAIFERLGVDIKTASGELRLSNDIFNETITALGQMDNQVERNAMALKLLGEAGGAGLIQSGALENLQAMTDLATQFGISVEQNAVQSMATFQRRVAEFSTVSIGEMQRVVESIAGPQSINAAIEFVTQSVIYMGSLTRDTLAVVGQVFENTFVLAQAGYMAMTGDVERAQIIINDAAREQSAALENMSNMFTRASERVDEFNRLSAASTAPTIMNQTTVATQATTQAMQELSEASADVAESIDLIGEFINDAMLKNVELELQVRDRLTPEYQKQVNAIKELGQAIDAQINSTELQIDALIDAAMVRELSVEEQQQLLVLADELDQLEKTAALNRLAEQKELDNIDDETNKKRLEAIKKRAKAEADANAEALQNQIDSITRVADAGTHFVNVLSGVSDVMTAVHDKQIDEFRDRADSELKAIETMVKSGVMTTTEAAQQREKIENSYAQKVSDLKIKEFRVDQASAVSSIAFETAKAIAQSLTLPPVARGAAIAAISATSALQTAAVLAQSPPKFDVGGMVGGTDSAPDVVQANLLKGEAVLDRSTVQSLGGAEGVRRLQNQSGQGGAPIIIQPFKHFDRYSRAVARMTPRRVGSGAY